MDINIIKNKYIITPIISFILGIPGLILLFYPLLLLRLPIDLFLEPYTVYNSFIAISIVYIVVFLVIGILIKKLVQKKFSNINIYLTTPFIFPIIFGLYFMIFFETGNATSVELLLSYIAVFLPLVSYLVGLVISNKT